jgi:hypothetical protein
MPSTWELRIGGHPGEEAAEELRPLERADSHPVTINFGPVS